MTGSPPSEDIINKESKKEKIRRISKFGKNSNDVVFLWFGYSVDFNGQIFHHREKWKWVGKG